MSDKATMLRETDEALADLRARFDGLAEEQATRAWLGVLGVRDIVIHIHWPAMLRGCGDQTSQAAERTHAESIDIARTFWGPGSFWALRYPSKRSGI
jgi:hypothetical protein